MFVGVDLAWSRNNETGVAVLSDESEPRVVDQGLVVEDEDILGLVPDSPVLVGVDAPLVVPNEEGQRPAEDELRPVYAEYNAGPYPANRNWLNRLCGEVRGEVLVDHLRGQGFEHNPRGDRGVDKGVLEVYPHPAMVAFFGLDGVIPYKDKQGRSKAEQIEGLRTLRDFLARSPIRRSSLPGLDVSADDTYAEIKQYEDLLDAVVSGLVAWYAWRHDDVVVFGNVDEGYISSPPLGDGNILKR